MEEVDRTERACWTESSEMPKDKGESTAQGSEERASIDRIGVGTFSGLLSAESWAWYGIW